MDDDAVFKALADPTRRAMLDALYARDGLSSSELAAEFPEMTRFGVAKHLGVLIDARLIVVHRSGRSKHHYLNPGPLRSLHDRWLSKYAAAMADGLADVRRRAEAASGTTSPRHQE